MMTKQPIQTEEKEELSYYAIKMARYYEEEWDKLFKTKSKVVQKIILHEPSDRVSIQFAKDIVKAAESRDYDDDRQEH
jgi:hypothetical protein